MEDLHPEDQNAQTPVKSMEPEQPVEKLNEMKPNEDQMPKEKKEKKKYIKRNSFEKTVDDSLTILDKMVKQDKIQKDSVNKLVQTIEKEINRKGEFYHFVQLYDKIKAYKETIQEETEINNKEEFNNYISDFKEIKNELLGKKRKPEQALPNVLTGENQTGDNLNKEIEKDKEVIENINADVAIGAEIKEEIKNDINIGNIPLETGKKDEVKEKIEKKEKKKKPKKLKLGNAHNDKSGENKNANEDNSKENNETDKKNDKNIKNSPDKKKNEKEKIIQTNKISNYFGIVDKANKKLETEDKDIQMQSSNNQIQNMNNNNLPSSNINSILYPNSNLNLNLNQNEQAPNIQEKNKDNINIITQMIQVPQKIQQENKNIIPTNALLIENNTITYNLDKLNPNLPHYNELKSFNSIEKMQILNKNEYFLSLKNYFTCFKQEQKSSHIGENPVNKQKFIFIHNSGYQYRKNPGKLSTKISPKNPFSKDAFSIDYDRDSDEEFQEDNGIDIKSVENSNNEEEEDESEDNNAVQWIVKDGHLSEDELSNKDAFEDNEFFAQYQGKTPGMKEILKIRKNYEKPIISDFTRENNILYDSKQKNLWEKLTISLFFDENENKEEEITTNDINNTKLNKAEEENVTSNNRQTSFPIKIIRKNKDKKNIGIKDVIINHLDDIIRYIHGSYSTKDQMIIDLNKKFSEIPKKTLDTFFKDKCVKIKNAVNSKYYWSVKKELIAEIHLSQNEIDDLINKHYKELEEQENKKKKEMNENKIMQLNLKNENPEGIDKSSITNLLNCKPELKGSFEIMKPVIHEIAKIIHGSYLTKEQMIVDLNKKHGEIPKMTFDKLFKEKCVRYKNDKYGKYIWIFKKDFFGELGLSEEELKGYIDENEKNLLEKIKNEKNKEEGDDKNTDGTIKKKKIRKKLCMKNETGNNNTKILLDAISKSIEKNKEGIINTDNKEENKDENKGEAKEPLNNDNKENNKKKRKRKEKVKIKKKESKKKQSKKSKKNKSKTKEGDDKDKDKDKEGKVIKKKKERNNKKDNVKAKSENNNNPSQIIGSMDLYLRPIEEINKEKSLNKVIIKKDRMKALPPKKSIDSNTNTNNIINKNNTINTSNTNQTVPRKNIFNVHKDNL